jgi:succinoglycan biosynthesis protein ExoV
VILYQWRGASTNFGDELNTILWPRLLPDFFDDDAAVRFLGVGSVMDQRHPIEPLKIVAGSGYGGYEGKPVLDQNWVIHWVRGPRTAAQLGLPSRLGLGDPAVLIKAALEAPGIPGNDIGFMPHFESAARGAWQEAAEQAGVRLIDPRDPPRQILKAIGECKLLLSEALHGVIVADALRVPWIAIRPRARVHWAKWSDWADTMALCPRFYQLPASTLAEWAATSPLRSWHASRTWLVRHEDRMRNLTSERFVVQASQALKNAMQAEPQLSSDTVLNRCQSRMLDAVQALAINPLRTMTYAAWSARASRCLQADTATAYQPALTG